MSVFGVILVRILPHSNKMWRDSLSLRIQSDCRKIRTKITPNADTFYSVTIELSHTFVSFGPTTSEVGDDRRKTFGELTKFMGCRLSAESVFRLPLKVVLDTVHSGEWLALESERFLVRARSLVMCQSELSAVIAWLMFKYLWIGWKW